MRINSIPPKELYDQYVHVKRKAEALNLPQQAIDKADLSSNALSFSGALKQAKESLQLKSEIDSKKVEDIRRQIENGTYSVPGRLVADKILGDLDL